MAVIKDYKEIEMIIPDRGFKYYDSPVRCVDDVTILNNPTFANIVNKAGRVTNVYKMVFFVQKAGTRYKLFLTNIVKNMDKAVDYVYVNNINEPWPFKTDEIGLYLQSESSTGNKIYFTTKINDVHLLRKALGDEKPVHRTLYVSEVII